MAIQYIGANWRAAQKTMALDERVYIDFRQQIYPDSGIGAPTFSVVSSTDNVSGSHYMSGGWGDYLVGLTSTVSVTAYVKPTFAYDVASDQVLWSWYNDATHKLDCFYRAADDLFCVSWQDGGTRRELTSPAYASNPSLQSWVDLTLTFNGSQVEQTGSKFWVNGAKADEDWGGANDVVTSAFPKFTIRGENGTSAGFQIAYVRLFPNLKEDYSNNYKSRKNEEIVWHMNGVPHGHTRCNVTARAQDMSIEKAIESPLGRSVASRLNLTLLSPTGQFADDQYATFAPTSEAYNGTSAQKFLQNRCPIEVETWYGGTYEHEFVGRVSEEKFTRASGYGLSSRVRISADDALWDIRKRVKRNSSAYEDYDLSSPASVGTSLLHTLTYLASDKEWYNFAPNASFETATGIASSVTIVGTGATFTQLLTASSIHGSAVSFLEASVPASIEWIVQYGASKNINVGQKWTASIYVKSNTVTSAGFSIIEYDGTTTVASTVDSQNLVAGAWTVMQATYTVSTSAADIFRIRFTKTGSSSCQFDNLQLVQNNERLPWVINTTMVGAAGTTQSASAQSATYHTIGIDADDADFVQGYQVVKAGNTIWGYMQELSDATVAMYMGMTSCNTLKYRTPLKTGYADPSALFTVGLNMQNVNTIINNDCANKIIVKGCKILKDTTVRTIWNAAATGSFDMNGQLLNVLCTAGSYFPDKVEFGDYWAEYSNVSEKTQGLSGGRGQFNSQEVGATNRTVATNNQGEEILGVKDPSIVIRTLSCGAGVQPLNLVTFDTTTRPDAANILYYNSTGNNQTISTCAIRGKLIRKTASGKGFVHDSFVDYERIEKDGEQALDFESNMITSRAQTDKVADYLWKRNRTPKHIYRTSEP